MFHIKTDCLPTCSRSQKLTTALLEWMNFQTQADFAAVTFLDDFLSLAFWFPSNKSCLKKELIKNKRWSLVAAVRIGCGKHSESEPHSPSWTLFRSCSSSWSALFSFCMALMWLLLLVISSISDLSRERRRIVLKPQEWLNKNQQQSWTLYWTCTVYFQKSAMWAFFV